MNLVFLYLSVQRSSSSLCQDSAFTFIVTNAALVDTVRSTGGNLGDAGEGRGTLGKGRIKRAKQAKPDSQRLSVIPAHMLVTDVSQVKPATHIFKRLVFCILAGSPVEHIDSCSGTCLGVNALYPDNVTDFHSIACLFSLVPVTNCVEGGVSCRVMV